MINSVLKMVLKWKQHFLKVNCNNCRVHLFWGFGFFFGGQGCTETSFQIDPFQSLMLKDKTNWGGLSKRQDICEVVEEAV